MTSILAAKIIAYGTCLFLLPFWLQAYFKPLASLNLKSIGLVPAEGDRLNGLSNLRGSVGGLRLTIIITMGVGAYTMSPDLCLAAAVAVGTVSSGRLLSLALDGWHKVSFITAASELVMALAMLHLGAWV